MPPAHWRLILNGKSAGDDALRDAVQALRERGQRLDVRVTWERGDADRIVAEALEDGVGVLIAAGGDGTLSEGATAPASRDPPAGALPAPGLVPMGTAHAFRAVGSVPEAPLPAATAPWARSRPRWPAAPGPRAHCRRWAWCRWAPPTTSPPPAASRRRRCRRWNWWRPDRPRPSTCCAWRPAATSTGPPTSPA